MAARRSFSSHGAMAVAALLAASPALAGGGDLDALPSSGGFSLQVGGLAVVKPKYEGSKEYEIWGVPVIAPAGGDGSGLVQFKGVDDLRLRVLNANGFEAGPVVGYRFGRDEDDADRLVGMGDVDGGLVVGGYVAYRLGSVMPFISYNHQVTGDETGGLARIGIETRHEFGRGVVATLTGGATWADEEYMDAYFGVSAAQALASPVFVAFDADSGFKDAFIGASVDVPLSERWTLKMTGRYAHLLGDASSSPISETDSQWMGGLGFTYRFAIDR